MHKKNHLLAAAALSAALGTPAQAQKPTDVVCADNQTKIVTALQGTVGCRDVAPTGLPEVFVPRTETRTPLIEATLGGVSSRFGQGGQAGVQLNLDRVSLAGNAIVTPDELRTLITAGLRVTPELAVIAGVGYAEEDAGKAFGNTRYNGKKITGESAYARVEYMLPYDSIIGRAFIEYMQAKGKTTLLDTTYATSFDTRTEDFRAFVRTITTTHFDTTYTSFTGDTVETMRGGLVLNVGKNGQVTVTTGAVKDRNGYRAMGGVTAEYFGGQYKYSASVLGSSGSSSVGARVETLLPQVSKGLSAYAEASQIRTPGAKPNTTVGVGFSYALGESPRYVRPVSGVLDIAGSVRGLASDHANHGVGSVAALGRVESITTRKSVEKSSDAAKMPESVNIKNTTINPNGSVTLSFDMLSPWTYECQIDGKTLSACTSPFTTPVLSPGSHTVSIRSVNNEVKGTTVRSDWKDVKLSIFADTEALVLAPEIISIGYTLVSFRYRISDTDGVRNQTCSVNGKTVTPDKDGICTVTGLTPGERVTLTTKGEVNVKQPNGSDLWVPKEVSTPVTLSIATDAPTIITLDVANVTTNSLLAKCNIDDRNGATGTCTLSDANNQVVASWSIGADRPITGLLPGASYTLALVGTAVRRNPDDTLSNVGVNRLLDIKTQDNTSVNMPPVPTFTGFTVDASLTMNATGQLTATDANNDPLTYALVTAPTTGSLVVNSNGSYTYTGSVMPRTYTFVYSVTDGKSAPVTKTAMITVNDVAPVAPTIPPVVVNDRFGALPITPFSVAGATDPLGRTFTYKYTMNTPLPTGLTLDPDTGIISGMHDANGTENSILSIRATRGTTSYYVNYSVSLRINDEG